jgi:hypothetical protein
VVLLKKNNACDKIGRSRWQPLCHHHARMSRARPKQIASQMLRIASESVPGTGNAWRFKQISRSVPCFLTIPQTKDQYGTLRTWLTRRRSDAMVEAGFLARF